MDTTLNLMALPLPPVYYMLRLGSSKVLFWVHFCLPSILATGVKMFLMRSFILMLMILLFTAVVQPLFNHSGVCSLPLVL